MSADHQQTKISPLRHFDQIADAYERATGGSTRVVARHVLQLPALRDLFANPHEAVVLDNACGTAIVAEEIISRCRKHKSGAVAKDDPFIHAVDPAQSMVTLATAKLAALAADGRSRTSVAAIPGEKLAFPDDTFSHSITNMGIMFFGDAAAGAREIYRTLKPGGVAVVTTWARLGYLDEVLRPAQERVRPSADLQPPFDPRWFDPACVETCLRNEGGFEGVTVERYDLHYSAPSVDAVCDQVLELLAPFYQSWKENELEAFRDAARELTAQAAVPCATADGSEGFGIPISATIAVCVK